MSPRARKSKVQEPEPEAETVEEARDFAMARAAAALADLRSAEVALTEFVGLCLDPAEDTDGSQREQLLEDADEAAGGASRAIQLAQEAWENADAEAEEPEKWEN